MFLLYKLVSGRVFVKILASLMRIYFPKRPSGAPLHTLSKLYDVSVGFVNSPPSSKAVYFFILRLPKGGCCSISNDLSCSFLQWFVFRSVWYIPPAWPLSWPFAIFFGGSFARLLCQNREIWILQRIFPSWHCNQISHRAHLLTSFTIR